MDAVIKYQKLVVLKQLQCTASPFWRPEVKKNVLAGYAVFEGAGEDCSGFSPSFQ